MGVRKLDRNRYKAIVYGDPEKAFMQDGIFFDAAGNALDGETKPPEEPQPANEPVAVVEQPDDRSDELLELTKLHITKLKKIAATVNASTGVPLPKGGTGAKARLVKYIADNTE